MPRKKQPEKMEYLPGETIQMSETYKQFANNVRNDMEEYSTLAQQVAHWMNKSRKSLFSMAHAERPELKEYDFNVNTESGVITIRDKKNNG